MADYVAKLADQRSAANVAARVKRGKAILAELGPWIDRYRGGMPAGFAAAVIQWESNGQMGATGDVGLGEAGYFQITATFPPSVGVPATVRLQPEGNVALGLLEYQIEAVKLWLADPNIVLGSADSWKLARLAFAIGAYGAKTLVQEAGPTQRGKVFDAVRAYVDRTGGRAFGSMSAGLVWYRVHTIDLVWQIGQAIEPGSGSRPSLPPALPGTPYTLPASVRPFIKPPTSPVVLAGAVLLALGVYSKLSRS